MGSLHRSTSQLRLLTHLLLPLTFILLTGAAQPEIQVDADSATLRGNKEPKTVPDIHAVGHVHATRGAMQLRGEDLVVDRDQRYGILEGNVAGVDGLMVLFGKKLRFDLPTHTMQLFGNATVIVKKSTGPTGTTAAALATGFNSSDPLCVRKMGGNALTLRAEWIRRNPDLTFEAKPVWFTTCACSDGCRPLLSVSAASAWIKPGDRANFDWALIRLFDVPILPVPWMSMPLADRETGLLFPYAGQTATGGITLGEPLFVTLGRSADITVQGMYYFGTSNANNGGTSPQTEGVRGPGDDIELRWRPADDSVGSLRVLHVFDTSKADYSGIRGNRGELWLTQQQGVLGGHAGLEFNAASDSDVVADTALTTVEQNRSYLRSWAEYSRTLGPFDFSLDSNYVEDLQASVCSVTAACFPRTPWRLIPSAVTPVARASIGTANRLGWLTTSEQLTVAYEDSWAVQPPPDTPHEQRLSTSLALTQTLPFASGRYGTLALETGERLEDLDEADTSGLRWRGGGYAGILARTTIGRTFASGWVHDIVPSLQVRALDTIGNVPYSRGLYADRFTGNQLTPLPQDELDLALPSQATVQGILALTTHLSPPKSPPVTLTVEQHLAFFPFDSGQLKASVSVPFGFNSIALSGGREFSPGIVGWTPATIAYNRLVPGAATISVGASYGNAFTDDQVSRGVDLLFTPRFELPPIAETGPPAISYAVFLHVMLTNLGPVAVMLNGTLTDLPDQQPSVLIQDYGLSVYYDAPGCGKLSLIIHWVHTSGQPLAWPIATPNYLFGDMRDITRAQQSMAGPGM